jgi:hypothetical protein
MSQGRAWHHWAIGGTNTGEGRYSFMFLPSFRGLIKTSGTSCACQEDGPAVLRDVNLGRLNGDAARAKVAASAAVATTSEASLNHVQVRSFQALKYWNLLRINPQCPIHFSKVLVMHCIFNIKYIFVTKTPTFHICFVCQANRGKDMYVKYIDSVLQKSAKIRSLIGDLQKIIPKIRLPWSFSAWFQVNDNQHSC